MKSILDSKGHPIFVDDEDLVKVEGISFYCQGDCIGSMINGKWKNIASHIIDVPLGCVPDHKDGDIHDNRKSNLRVATKSQNAINSKLRSSNSTGYRGVHLNKTTGRFVAQKTHNRKVICIGTFDTAEEAARAYDKVAVDLDGEFAKPNIS